MQLEIRSVDPRTDSAVQRVVGDAFGSDIEYGLIESLREDPTAWVPAWSLGAYDGGELLGHILFTPARAGDAIAALLAPLAVAPASQHGGVGSALVRAGLEVVAADGAEVALVLGHPDYYPRAGFEPAMPHGIEPPYPVDPPEAWMALELVPGAFLRAAGVVGVAAAFADPAMWRE